MNMKAIMNATTRAFGKTMLVVKKHSPEILLVGGIAAGATAIVLAVVETRKVDEVTAHANEEIDDVHARRELQDETEYPKKSYSKDLTVAYAHKVGAYVKLYWPCATSAVLSTACFLGSYGILHKRNVALVAAYKSLETAFGEYRKRVRDELGEEADLRYRYGFDKVTKVEDPSGNTYEVETKGENCPLNTSLYAICFDETCTEWENNSEYNRTYLRDVENLMNKRLAAKGHVFLNEVLDQLGAQRTKAGQIVGWLYDGKGDNEIKFDLFTNPNRAAAFANGYEPSIWVDFNVDGPIIDTF